MIQYTTEQLATIITAPVVTILLLWTVAIFHKNRNQWGPYDIPIVAVLVLSVLRNLTVFAYTLIAVLNQTLVGVECCSSVVWIFNSVHTFQASSLTTLAVIGLFAAKLHRKQQNLRQFLTATHVVYHLFCLTTLCACVGVAAVLAQHPNAPRGYLDDGGDDANPCRFMPYQLDIKFNVFIIVLHIFLAIVSVTTFLLICYHHYRAKINAFDYLKKSTSDLSELSVGMTFAGGKDGGGKGYYDTYTIHRVGPGENYYEPHSREWSDVSNISATVSSTNSRRPCLVRPHPREEEEEFRTGLETIHPVLIVCYLFYHLPLIGLCIFPRIIAPWPVAGAALWLGLLQDVLIPTSLGLVDTRFCKWVSDVYRCSSRCADEKLPQVGIDGKFRPFGSQPQSLEIMQAPTERTARPFQPTEHKFPITNGSLYTSIDGRVPVIHNYRRQYRDQQRGARSLEGQSINLGIHSTHLRRNNSRENFLDAYQNQQKYCGNCEANLCSSRSDLHHLAPHNRNFNYINNNNLLIKRVSLSQNSLSPPPPPKPDATKPILRKPTVRLSKSDDHLGAFSEPFTPAAVEYTSSEEEYSTDTAAQNFDTASLESSYSITTEANCDFEFFGGGGEGSNVICMHVKAPPVSNCIAVAAPAMETFKPRGGDASRGSSRSGSVVAVGDAGRNLKIRRSNSKRSLENFRSFVSEVRVQRGGEWGDVGELSKGSRRRNKSVEVLSNVGSSVVYVGEPCVGKQYHGGSVPDFKKVFVSEYI